MNENGGSIPTDSEEWTLNLLDFILMNAKLKTTPKYRRNLSSATE